MFESTPFSAICVQRLAAYRAATTVADIRATLRAYHAAVYLHGHALGMAGVYR